MSKYALISDQDIVSDNNSEMELLQHLEKDFNTDEYKDFLEVTKFMYTLRCTLHIIANRREDRLLFDFQEDLANKLGYKKTKTKPRINRKTKNVLKIVII